VGGAVTVRVSHLPASTMRLCVRVSALRHHFSLPAPVSNLSTSTALEQRRAADAEAAHRDAVCRVAVVGASLRLRVANETRRRRAMTTEKDGGMVRFR